MLLQLIYPLFGATAKGGGGVTPRQQAILSYILEQGSGQIRDLSGLFGVSEATVRRDLDALADNRHIERIHGGGMRINSTTFERQQDEKMKLMLAEKQRIAHRAASLVQSGDSLFLDTGTTTYFVALALAQLTDLTIVTNNLDIAYCVRFHSSTSLIVTGGLRRDNYAALIGHTAEKALDDYYVDHVFFACDAIDAVDGVSNSNHQEVGIKQRIIRCGKQVILITDHTKFSCKALAKICPLSDIDIIITDDGLEPAIAKKIQRKVDQLYIV